MPLVLLEVDQHAYPTFLVTARRTLLATRGLYTTGATPNSNPKALELRPYQEECIQACLKALNAGRSRIAVSLPTGSGKTAVFAVLLSRILPPADRPDATRALVLVSSVELARQAEKQFRRLFPLWSVEVEQAGNIASGNADVTIATYQTLTSSDMYRLDKFDPRFYKAVIVDEAHHAAARSYCNILSKFHQKIIGEYDVAMHKTPIIGLSATLTRSDARPLRTIFPDVVYKVPLVDLIQDGWLCNLRCTTIHGELELDEQKVSIDPERAGFNQIELAAVMNTDYKNRMIVQSWREKAARRRSTLVFCANTDHVESLCRTFRDQGIDARFIHTDIAATLRDDLLESFKAGEYPVLVNCNIVKEGVDIPSIDCIVMARPTPFKAAFAQMVGRGTRLSPETGKKDCLVILLADSAQRAVPFTCLLDDEELDSNAEDTPSGIRRRSHRRQLRVIKTQESTPTAHSAEDVDLIYEDSDLLTLTAERYTHSSKYAWTACRDDIYVLNGGADGSIYIAPTKVQDEQALYMARFEQGSKHLLQSSKLIYAGSSVKAAVIASEKYLESDVPWGARVWLLRSARWRSEKVSSKQIEYLRGLFQSNASPIGGVRGDKTSTVTKDFDSLTKGEAAELITAATIATQFRDVPTTSPRPAERKTSNVASDPQAIQRKSPTGFILVN